MCKQTIGKFYQSTISFKLHSLFGRDASVQLSRVFDSLCNPESEIQPEIDFNDAQNVIGVSLTQKYIHAAEDLKTKCDESIDKLLNDLKIYKHRENIIKGAIE
jgi:hypothetical protein